MNSTASGSALFAWLLLLLLRPRSGSSQLLDEACGIRAPAVAPRVVNGSIAGMNSSPWMVFLHTTDRRFICGGTLISHRLVLTAAHCILPDTQLVARLGEYQRSKKDQCYNTAAGPYCTNREEHYVEMGIRHPNYNPATQANDIAILQLATTVVYKNNIRPICIVLNPRWRNYINSLSPLTGTGWGKTQDEPDSDYLKSLSIERQDPEICTQFIHSNALASNQFCAGNPDSNLCHGDSGGPVGALVQIGNTKRFIQVGIFSYTNQQCALASVFTDVLSHADWIKRVFQSYDSGEPQPTRTVSAQTSPPTRQSEQVYTYYRPSTW